MAAKGAAPLTRAVSNGLTPARSAVGNGLAERVVPGHSLHSSGRERLTGIQRARMLAAMVEVSAERGVANTTVADVVERAGVSRRTFYEIFADRDECFLAAFDDGIARATRHVLDGYDPAARWAERIRTALAALLSFLDADRGAGQLLLVGSLGAGAQALARRQAVLAQAIAVVDEGRAETKAGPDLPALTAEGVVGGVLSVLHARLLDPDSAPLVELTGPLMAMIVLPYLGAAASRKQLSRPVPESVALPPNVSANPLGGLEMRLTYRTVRALMAIAEHPGSSNRAIASVAEVVDQGQMSKLLARLAQLGLIENTGGGANRGERNAWALTEKGWRVQGALAEEGGRG